MGAKILSWQTGKRIDAKKTNRTTLSREYVCDNCGELAMTQEDDRLRCPSCWLRDQGRKIKPLDHSGYRP
jgi:formylmethanofuran dehydrogenase subunit E